MAHPLVALNGTTDQLRRKVVRYGTLSIMGNPIPKRSILQGFEALGLIHGSRRWRSHGGKRLYTWDSLHGEVEVFNERGRHLGALDPKTGRMIKLLFEAERSMSKKISRFMDRYLAGRASSDDINESIDAWHSGLGESPIYEYLGMTRQEYSMWLRDPEALPQIVRARREHRSISKVIDSLTPKRPKTAPVRKERSQKPAQKKVG